MGSHRIAMYSRVRHWLCKVEAVGGRLSPHAIAKLEGVPASAGRDALARTYAEFGPEVQDTSALVCHLLNQEAESSAASKLAPPSSQPNSVEHQMAWLSLSPEERTFFQLPFRKRFPILKHFGVQRGVENWKGRLDNETISRFQCLSDGEVENCLQSWAGKHSKAQVVSGNVCGNHCTYNCRIDGDRNFTFSGPHSEHEGTPLQGAFGDENVLRVRFDAGEKDDSAHGIFRHIRRTGLVVGGRTYAFFAYKDAKAKKKDRSGTTGGDQLKKSCVTFFFVCIRSVAQESSSFRDFKSIQEARNFMGHFSSVPTLSKRIARFQLVASKTTRVPLDWSKVRVVDMDDTECKEGITTDGAGYVSEDIARACPRGIYQGRKLQLENDDKEEYPLLMQIRLLYQGNVYKGLCQVDIQLDPGTIVLRKSMKKVSRDPMIEGPSYNSLELCATSRKPRMARLSQTLILLLSEGSIPTETMISVAKEALKKALACTQGLGWDPRLALAWIPRVSICLLRAAL